MCDPANAGWRGAAITAGSSQCHLSDRNLGVVIQYWCLSSTWIVLRSEFRWQSFECLSGTFWLVDANTCSGEFLLQFKKATSSASVCEGCMAKTWKKGLEITTVVVKTRGGMFLLSVFFSEWIRSLTDILVSAFYTIGVNRVKAFCTIEAANALAWKIPWMEEPGRLQSMGSLRVPHDWEISLSLFTFMRWRRKWQPTPGFLPGESQGCWSLVGCRLWGCTESDTTEVTQQQQSHLTPGCGVLACRDEVVWG